METIRINFRKSQLYCPGLYFFSFMVMDGNLAITATSDGRKGEQAYTFGPYRLDAVADMQLNAALVQFQQEIRRETGKYLSEGEAEDLIQCLTNAIPRPSTERLIRLKSKYWICPEPKTENI